MSKLDPNLIDEINHGVQSGVIPLDAFVYIGKIVVYLMKSVK